MKENDYTIVTIFLLGIIIALYYMVSVMTAASVTAILEKTILVGVLIAILITIAIMLFRIMELKKELESGVRPGAAKAPAKRTAKDVKSDMMKIYRDMGAFRIVQKDNLIDKATYDKERKALDTRLAVLKKEYESLAGKPKAASPPPAKK
jgi:hypothetical protein